MTEQPKVVITDYDYGDFDIERRILEAAGARVVALQAKSEEDLFTETDDCDAVMNQYQRVGAATIARMRRCKVIARYGIGVDIVDVDAATGRAPHIGFTLAPSSPHAAARACTPVFHTGRNP